LLKQWKIVVDRNIHDVESVEIDVDVCMALCNLKRRAADGTLDSIPKRAPKGATSRNITPPTVPVVSIPRALPAKPRSWIDDASMLKRFHAFLTSAAPQLKKLLVNGNHFTPTVQTRGQGLHDGAFVLQYSLYETATGGWWVVPRCGASYNMWNYIGAFDISPAFDIAHAVCSCTNGYTMHVHVVSNGFLLTPHQESPLFASLGLLAAPHAVG
jgi:hypothetical protein